MGRQLRVLSLCCVLLLVAASPAAAQVYNWLVPASGAVWTAGTTHTVEWSGGPAGNANVSVIRISPFQVAAIVATATSNDGTASWSIPATLTPGAYQLYIENPTQTEWRYGPQFTINAPPPCAPNCQLASVAMPYLEPPAGVCGPSASEATSYAQAWAQSHFACPDGFVLDAGSMVIDVTFLPVGVCLSGYSGPFVAEASAVACCCAEATPTRPSTWGRLKSVYR